MDGLRLEHVLGESGKDETECRREVASGRVAGLVNGRGLQLE